MSIRPAATVVSIAAVLASLAFVTAGPINPPSGPVSSTGKTNQQIFDAVQGAAAGSTGAGRIAGIPGSDQAAGEIEFAAAGGMTARSTLILGCNVNLFQPTSGGLPSGKAQIQEISVVRELGKHAVAPFRALTTNLVFPEVTIRLYNAEGLITYTITDARVSKVTTELRQRADGTFAQLETLVFTTGTSLEIKTNEGTAKYLVNPAT